MGQSVVKGKHSEILVAREPRVFHFEVTEGALVCLYHPQSHRGGGVMLRSQSPTVGSVLQNLVKSLVGITKADPSEFQIKVVGSSGDVDYVRLALQTLSLKVEKELREDQKKIEAFFYSDTGRLRIGAVEEPVVKTPTKGSAIATQKKKRVLIVDDSKTIRTILTKVFSMDSRLEVVGAVERPSEVEAKIRELKPDVISLDIHMPEMDGVTLLKKVIIPKFHLPTVMITSLRMEDGPAVLDALESGAIDYIQKPSMEELNTAGQNIADRMFEAANSKVKTVESVKINFERKLEDIEPSMRNPVICIGSSTGGTEALRELFCHFPKKIPPVVVVQHIPAVFSTAFAQRLNEIMPFQVKEAETGDEVLSGRILIAPGGKQMRLVRKPTGVFVEITDDPPVNRFKPSVDYLFNTCVDVLGKRAIGVILTGMGADGAKGLLAMRQAGAKTVGQDEASCVVYGMPRAAKEIGALDEVKPLDQIAAQIWKFLKKSEDSQKGDRV